MLDRVTSNGSRLDQAHFRVGVVVNRVVVLQENVTQDPVVGRVSLAEFLVGRSQPQGSTALTHLLHVGTGWQAEPLSAVFGESTVCIQEHLESWKLREVLAFALSS